MVCFKCGRLSSLWVVCFLVLNVIGATARAEMGFLPPPKVVLNTSKGEVVIELNSEKAPASVDNFLAYVRKGFYDGVIFHRVISGFMIQGGGFNEHMVQKATAKPIKNESFNGLKNDRGTISMARTNNPDSATSQFFINLVDNHPLNAAPGRPGYAVFGKVVQGMNVVDAIAGVQTGQHGMHRDVPREPILIHAASVVDDVSSSDAVMAE